jgi:hypothetical protein
MPNHLEAVRPLKLHEIESARERIAGTVSRRRPYHGRGQRSEAASAECARVGRGAGNGRPRQSIV